VARRVVPVGGGAPVVARRHHRRGCKARDRSSRPGGVCPTRGGPPKQTAKPAPGTETARTPDAGHRRSMTIDVRERRSRRPPPPPAPVKGPSVERAEGKDAFAEVIIRKHHIQESPSHGRARVDVIRLLMKQGAMAQDHRVIDADTAQMNRRGGTRPHVKRVARPTSRKACSISSPIPPTTEPRSRW